MAKAVVFYGCLISKDEYADCELADEELESYELSIDFSDHQYFIYAKDSRQDSFGEVTQMKIETDPNWANRLEVFTSNAPAWFFLFTTE